MLLLIVSFPLQYIVPHSSGRYSLEECILCRYSLLVFPLKHKTSQTSCRVFYHRSWHRVYHLSQVLADRDIFYSSFHWYFLHLTQVFPDRVPPEAQDIAAQSALYAGRHLGAGHGAGSAVLRLQHHQCCQVCYCWKKKSIFFIFSKNYFQKIYFLWNFICLEKISEEKNSIRWRKKMSPKLVGYFAWKKARKKCHQK